MPSTASFWTIINAVYDSGSAALRMNLSYDHTHSSGSGSGGQLDWDVIWSDAVHSHGTDTEGGQLVAATAVPNAVTKNTLTTLGDIPYASGSATWTRLGIGGANAALAVNDAGTGYTWTATIARIASGRYSGNGSANRVMSHSMGVTPRTTFIATSVTGTGGAYQSQIHSGTALLLFLTDTGGGSLSVTAMDGTSFYVGNSSNYNQSMNGTGYSYEWVSVG